MKMTSIQTTHRRQKMTTMAYRFRHPLNPPQTGTIAFLLIVQALHLLMGNRSSAPASLNTPLLPLPHEAMVSSSSSPSAATLEWPEEVAERVRLLVPHEYDPYQRDGPKMCMIRFHKEHKKFTIVAEETEETLDIIDPDDAIGVSIEIEMLDAASILVEPREEYVSPSPEQEGNNRASNEPASDTPVDTQGTAVLTIFAYPKRDACNKSTLGSCGWKNKPNPITEFSIEPEETTATAKPKNLGNRQQHHRRFTVAPTEDFADLSRLVSAMRNIIHGNKNVLEERRLLVIINPVSGRGNAQEVYQKIVMPIFEEASVPFDSLVTSYSRHAEERMRQLPKNGDIRDLSEYSGIVAIGGDGLVHEIMQGIHNRQDAKEIFKNVKLGMIGAGTSNGLSASLAHASEVSETRSGWATTKGIFLIALVFAPFTYSGKILSNRQRLHDCQGEDCLDGSFSV
jgi:sphingosine kinase